MNKGPNKLENIRPVRAEKALHYSDIGKVGNYGRQYQDEEISLIHYAKILLRRKKTIALIGAAITILAAVISFFMPAVYRSKVVFFPPTYTDIQAYNSQIVYKVTIEEAYEKFKLNLNSTVPRKNVFNKLDLIESGYFESVENKNQQKLFESFNKSLTIKATAGSGNYSNNEIILEMKGSNPDLIAQVLNALAEEVDQLTVAEIASDIRSRIKNKKEKLLQEVVILRNKEKKRRFEEINRLEIENQIKQKIIEDNINTLYTFSKQKRLDRIKQLEEANSIARTLEIKKPIENQADSPSKNSQIIIGIAESEPKLRSDPKEQTERQLPADRELFLDSQLRSTTQLYSDTQLYNRGYEAIEAEINTLVNRESDEPFTEKLRELQRRLALLKNDRNLEMLKNRKNDDPFIPTLSEKLAELDNLKVINIDLSSVKASRIDMPAFPPEDRESPKLIKFMSFGLIIGLLLGICYVLFSHFMAEVSEMDETPKA